MSEPRYPHDQDRCPIGGIIGALTQRDDKTGVMEDIPLKTGNPAKFMRGAYPLRWDQDYTNQPMISNTSDHTFSVRPYVIAKGVTYALPDSGYRPRIHQTIRRGYHPA